MKSKIIAAIVGASLVVVPAIAFAKREARSIEQLVNNCRQAAIASYRVGETTLIDDYVASLMSRRDEKRDEIIACGAYLAGVSDAALFPPKP